MASSDVRSAPPAQINAGRLFVASCMALISTAVSFAVIGAILGSLKSRFILTNEDVGNIAGAGTWGFTISIFVLGPLCDKLCMRRLIWFAFACHVVGPLMMIFSQSFWPLFFGALILSLGNGTVEAVCNPLVTTIYSDRKTQKLNQFHVWFPGGIVIGGLICYALSQLGNESWQIRLAVILIPTIVYGILFWGQAIPATERVQSGISFGQMVRATLLRPLFLIMFVCMMLTASMELGPNRWIPSILEAGKIPGILVLVWISGLMAVLRFCAGPVVHRLSPTGILLVSAILAGVGLYWLSYAETIGMAFAAATVFSVGVCYFWPTMLGFVAERVPRGGALALALMGGIGMLVVGVLATPMMGRIADQRLPDKLDAAKTIAVLEKVHTALVSELAKTKDRQKVDVDKAIADVKVVLETAKSTNALPHPATANALRAAIGTGCNDDAIKEAKDILGVADNYGGRMSFRAVAPLSLILIVVFGLLYAKDLAGGGYKVEQIASAPEAKRNSESPSVECAR